MGSVGRAPPTGIVIRMSDSATPGTPTPDPRGPSIIVWSDYI